MATQTAHRPATPSLAPSSRPQGQSYAIEVERLTKRYGRHTVVDDLSFTVQPGRVTGFLGPNGSGKSTTMKLILDLAAANAGHAKIGGHRYRDLDNPAQTVGVVLEPNAFHPGRSGRSHLRIVADTLGVGIGQVNQLLESVGLSGDAADRRVGSYSMGMKQRLSLAAALLCDPPVLILDEPSNGLDPQGIRALRQLLRSRAANGDTILVSSHLLSEMEHLADDLIVIDKGRLITSGAMEDLLQSASLVRSSAPERLKDLLTEQGATAELLDGDSLLVTGLTKNTIGDLAFSAGIAIHELSSQADSLEELFLSWTTTQPTSPNATTTKLEDLRL